MQLKDDSTLQTSADSFLESIQRHEWVHHHHVAGRWRGCHSKALQATSAPIMK